jgi:UDP-2,3-diacylglucosamine hydrolase
VAAYFASDVHLRLDRPARGRRLARFVESLEPTVDTLTIVGDLCDFWYQARQRRRDPLACPGLRALAAFRDRGGAVTIVLGNHDAWLGPTYATDLGLDLRDEPLEPVISGLRLRVVHGHRLGATRPWKAGMESRGFLRAFEALPDLAASGLDYLRNLANEASRARIEARYYRRFRQYADHCRGAADLVVIGHVHTPRDDDAADPRLVILGSWHDQSSYLRVDAAGASLVVESDDVVFSRQNSN